MSKISFVKQPDTIYEGCFTQMSANRVKLIFDSSIPSDEILVSGFNLVNENNGRIQTNRADYTTIYLKHEDMKTVELSNNNSVYIKPVFTVTFNTDIGGELEGETSQTSETYEGLTIPKPVPNENYTFLNWYPEIPESGEIEKNEVYTAHFEYVKPQSEILAEKITELKISCDELINAGVEVRGERYTYTSDERTNLLELYNTVTETGLPIGYQNAEGVCREYTAVEIVEIYIAQLTNKYSQETYRNQVIAYLNSLSESEENKDIISNYVYGTELTGEYLTHYNNMLTLYQGQVGAISSKLQSS